MNLNDIIKQHLLKPRIKHCHCSFYSSSHKRTNSLKASAHMILNVKIPILKLSSISRIFFKKTNRAISNWQK